MARLISEKQFNQLQSIIHRLQSLTDEQSEVGQLVDELDRILLDSDIEQAYQELTADAPRTKTHGAAYIV